MKRRCIRAEFTLDQLTAHEKAHWAMPARWVVAGSSAPMLRTLWRHGRSGAIGLLPLLGRYAFHCSADRWRFSHEELARLSGHSPATISRGGMCLGENRLACGSPEVRFGRYATVWNILPSIAAERNEHGFSEPFFFFASRWLYGGQWSRLSAAQQVVFLAIGGHSRTFDDPVSRNPLLRATGVDLSKGGDLKRCFEKTRNLRLACVSMTELQDSTGLSREAVRSAVAGFKHPELWYDSKLSKSDAWHLPVFVYPTGGGSLVYHLRDHAEPYPFDLLNRENPRSREVLPF